MSREAFEKWAKSGGYDLPRYTITAQAGWDGAWQARQPEIDSLETDNRRLSDSLEAIDLDTKILVDEIAALKDERDAHRDNAQKLVELNGKIIAENAALKAEVERLRKIAEPASLFLLSISCSASVSPVFRNIAKGHHEALDAAMKETK